MSFNNNSAATPAGTLRSLITHRQLATSMIQREIAGRYRGTFFGLLWSLFNPLLMLSAYTFVFSGLFKNRLPDEASSGSGQFALFIFTGMIVHGLFAENLNRAPTLILANPNFVKKVVFPLEILPWVSLGAALFHAFVSLLVLIGAHLALNHALPWTIIFIPVVLLPYLLLIMGVSWWLAATGVFLRDLAQTSGMISMLLLFLSPVFYPLSALPESYRGLLMLNPLTFIIEQMRTILLLGQPPDWAGLGLYLSGGLACAWLGFAWFQKTRRGFADVL